MPPGLASFGPLGWAGMALLPLAALSLYDYLAHLPPWYALFGDWRWHADALPRLLSAAPLYDPAVVAPHVMRDPPIFNLPPSTALFGLFFLLPGAPILWGLLMGACLVAGLALIWPRLSPGPSLLLTAALIAWLPIQSALAWANVNALIFVLLAVALRFPRHAGWAVGLAIAAKLVPVLMLGWLIGERRWRALAVAVAVPAVATLTVMLIEGPQIIWEFLLVRLNEYVPPSPTRWGLAPLGVPPLVVYGLGILCAGLAAWRRSYTLGVAAMLIALPSPHVHYWIWLLLPLLGLAHRWIPAATEWTAMARQFFGGWYARRAEPRDRFERRSPG